MKHFLLLLSGSLLHVAISSLSPSSHFVPIIDMAPLRDASASPDARAKTVAQIGKACETSGFFHVINHGISAQLDADFETQMKAFFQLSLEEKLKVKRTNDNSRGFADDELTKQRRDWKELFDFGHVPDRRLSPDHPCNLVVDGYNQWPESLPDFEATMLSYYDACCALSQQLVCAITESLGLAPNELMKEFAEHSSFLRLNWYPPASGVSSSSEVLGISRHTDAGGLTVLRQDEVNSLQVYSGTKEDNADGEWVTVTPPREALTINVGDMLQVWTNGLYQAPEHRVKANKTRERFSAPFFYNPSYETRVAPLPVRSPLSRDGSPAYLPMTWKHFRSQRFAGDYNDVGKEIQIENFLVQNK
uniref:Fe2OG dioxygenase domain-containing protein n=1 Tax=Octactis speculum TaxID=3111310 RepID=A0A7S2G393_9STRA|mmetsp:Transcript_37023/g.50091  ORF Transcript_37023/g.50091 Transcript_37023/m.50091 type:complete len:361 (+) Transcript_37023:179-1261(+)